ncbi:hypothetical protein GCM10007940_25360 [Portibacter lacus]|uniref:Uncharacterized protein n=1 Tax=Portibacter lacus TaxID=1099794 RepID=A0AA37WDI2_9BACT|nr:hypothetical protein GCM10007940_25360 [Portibacter lacus]
MHVVINEHSPLSLESSHENRMNDSLLFAQLKIMSDNNSIANFIGIIDKMVFHNNCDYDFSHFGIIMVKSKNKNFSSETKTELRIPNSEKIIKSNHI